MLFVRKSDFRVIVIEDERETCREIVGSLTKAGITAVGTHNQQEFNNELQGQLFDAAAIDWQINDRSIGKMLITEALKQQEHLGIGVYSRFEDRAKQMQKTKPIADVILSKTGIALDDAALPAAMTDISRIGRLRGICAAARKMGASLPFCETLGLGVSSLQHEKAIIDSAQQLIVDWYFKAPASASRFIPYIELFENFRVWPSLDMQAFLSAPWQNKFTALIEYSQLTCEYVAAVVQADELEVRRTIEAGDYLAPHSKSGLRNSLVLFYSVLANVFSECHHQPALMGPIWRREESSESGDTPVWMSMGLYRFLLEAKMQGVAQYLDWHKFSA